MTMMPTKAIAKMFKIPFVRSSLARAELRIFSAIAELIFAVAAASVVFAFKFPAILPKNASRTFAPSSQLKAFCCIVKNFKL